MFESNHPPAKLFEIKRMRLCYYHNICLSNFITAIQNYWRDCCRINNVSVTFHMTLWHYWFTLHAYVSSNFALEFESRIFEQWAVRSIFNRWCSWGVVCIKGRAWLICEQYWPDSLLFSYYLSAFCSVMRGCLSRRQISPSTFCFEANTWSSRCWGGGGVLKVAALTLLWAKLHF